MDMIKNSTDGRTINGVWAMPVAELDENYDEAFEFVMEKSSARERSFEASLVFEELFVNIMKYAYGSSSGPIMVKLNATDESLEMVFIDGGKTFDPTAYHTGGDMSKIGGHGIELVRAYTKAFNYARTFGTNITRVVI